MKSLKPILLALAALFAVALPEAALAQVVTQLPVFVNPNPSAGATDLGNGPMEIKIVAGAAMLGTSQGSGVGSTSGSSTTLTLTATPPTPPCVGCIISGTGVTPGTTVTAFNGTTTVTLSAAMTVAASTPLAWGAACPTTATVPVMSLTTGATQGATDYPLYTYARVCGYGQNTAGAQLLTFPIGAH